VTTTPSLENLRCFLAAARTGNFRRAAHEVALTATAFGQRIKQLEEQVGTQLFARTTRSVTLTEHGLAMVPRAQRCLAAADECAAVARGPTDHPPMDLTLGTRQELGMSWILPQRRGLMRERPWLNVHIYFSSGPDLLLRLRTLDIDCAVTSTSFSDPKLDSIQLHREDYVLVGAAGLLRRIPLRRPADAAKHTLIDASPDMPLFRYWRDAPRAGGPMRFARGSWMGSIAAIRHQILQGAGVGVLPEYFVRRELASGALVRVLPRVNLAHDYFRFVFRSADPRRALFESIAGALRKVPLA
jgi:DNA-binding transcriptional LysR family regulator